MAEFTEPKVMIDLAEYNHLKELAASNKEKNAEDLNLIALCEVLNTIVSTANNFEIMTTAMNTLHRCGYSMLIGKPLNLPRILPEHITIKKTIKKL